MIIPSVEGRTLTKAHGAGNDFILVPDFDGRLDISPDDVAALCDRHRGIGADGLIRVVRTAAVPEGADILHDHPEATWFMDYRNADGSIAEMCGNGVRVFVHYIRIQGIEPLGPGMSLSVATRGGVKAVSFDGELYTVDMGEYGTGAPVSVTIPGVGVRHGRSVTMPNPHVVVVVNQSELAAADFHGVPTYEPAPENGTNLEIVVPGEVAAMRVLERGVGETLACGTGTCAAAVALLAEQQKADGIVEIESPGGHFTARIEAGRIFLTGPAVLVAEVTVVGVAGY